MGRYRSEYPESYTEGSINRTFSLSKAAFDLLNENIDNASPFINDLILEALQEKDFFKKRLMGQMSKIREELRQKYGVDTEVEIKRC